MTPIRTYGTTLLFAAGLNGNGHGKCEEHVWRGLVKIGQELVKDRELNRIANTSFLSALFEVVLVGHTKRMRAELG